MTQHHDDDCDHSYDNDRCTKCGDTGGLDRDERVHIPSGGVVRTLTYSLAEAAAMIPCTERWLANGLRAGHFRGRKIMGSWRLTDGDIAAIIDASVPEPKPPMPTFNFVTPGSRRRIERGVNK